MRYFVLAALFIVTACGFEPVYKNAGSIWHAESSASATHLSMVEIAIIPDREGQTLHNHLIDRFYQNGYPNAPLYKLVTLPIKESVFEIGIDKDDNASRAQLRQQTEFRLIRLSDNKAVLNRTVRATTGYNILSGQFTTFVTENDARDQALQTLADNITTQLELYFDRQKQAQ